MATVVVILELPLLYKTRIRFSSTSIPNRSEHKMEKGKSLAVSVARRFVRISSRSLLPTIASSQMSLLFHELGIMSVVNGMN